MHACTNNVKHSIHTNMQYAYSCRLAEPRCYVYFVVNIIYCDRDCMKSEFGGRSASLSSGRLSAHSRIFSFSITVLYCTERNGRELKSKCITCFFAVREYRFKYYSTIYAILILDLMISFVTIIVLTF